MSTNFALATPGSPAPVPVGLWNGMSHRWVGWDGSSFDLSNRWSPVFLTDGGVEGLSMPPHQAWTGSSPAVHGQYYRGHVVEPRPVFWPLFVYSDGSSEDFLEVDRRLWRSLQPGKHGRWSVTTERGGTRSLSCRFVDDGQHAYTVDPVRRGWAKYGVSLVADVPFWEGAPVSRVWAQSAVEDFYAQRMPLRIVSGSQLSSARITNEGDLEAWPVWKIKGPLTSVTVGVDGRTVQWDVELTVDDTLVIDSDPAVQMAWANGLDSTHLLGAADFAPIPAGENRPLSLTMAGTGSVEATITPRFYRAF